MAKYVDHRIAYKEWTTLTPDEKPAVSREEWEVEDVVPVNDKTQELWGQMKADTLNLFASTRERNKAAKAAITTTPPHWTHARRRDKKFLKAKKPEQIEVKKPEIININARPVLYRGLLVGAGLMYLLIKVSQL